MKRTRRKFGSEFKARVAIEALKERSTLSELAEKYELYPNQISLWKQEFIEKSSIIFETKNKLDISFLTVPPISVYQCQAFLSKLCQ